MSGFARIVAASVITLALVGCGANPIDTQKQANGFTAELIGTVDGCRIWRIRDERTAYFARCPEGSATTATSFVSMAGKVVVTNDLDALGDTP